MWRPKILIFDPVAGWCERLWQLLQPHDVFSADTLPDALRFLEIHDVDLIVAEINSSGVEGMTVLEQLWRLCPQAGVLVHTEHSSIAQAVQTAKAGVVDYVEKSIVPAALDALREKIQHALSQRHEFAAEAAPDVLQTGLRRSPSSSFYGIVSQNPRMREIFEVVQTIADSHANVLIHGETGTGKELVANAIHQASNRRRRPFVTLDCSTMARELLESELFGHEKGAFTGATARHIGRFERANSGTLFLDEVANIDLAVQAKLLRVIETRTFERVGGHEPISVDVRIVAATNRPLDQCVATGVFRSDLYHRLNVVAIDLPALRDRLADVPLLAGEFLQRFAQQNSKEIWGFTDEAFATLCRYRWPGNVRELENVILQAVILAKSPLIDVSDLPPRVTQSTLVSPASPALADQLGGPEKQILLNALRQHAGNIRRAAQQLQISRTTFYAKLRKHQINLDGIR